ncbi:hypothetical protein [Micromonospora sp. NPDC048830]|uniref:hypothetical protein n=1 Tax=Micromonospora sp. NPDC048830 TaxID=3364257 RepID=UPI0037206CC8
MAEYEHDIAVVTHGTSDVPGALEFHPLLSLIGPHDVVGGVIDGLWLAVSWSPSRPSRPGWRSDGTRPTRRRPPH